MNAVVEAGDWVRWMRGGVLVMGVVQYVTVVDGWPWGVRLTTDNGAVAEKDVLEVRKEVTP